MALDHCEDFRRGHRSAIECHHAGGGIVGGDIVPADFAGEFRKVGGIAKDVMAES